MPQAAAARPVTQPLLVELKGPVLSIGINRPHKRNALDDATVLALEACFSAIPDGIRVAVIHGIGDHFSAGLDLSELTTRDVTEGVMHSRMWHRTFDRIQFAPVPVVAALKGAVIGGGLELACACHIRVAEASTFYALPEGQRGIFVGGGGSMRLPRLVGAARMADMMLTGRTYRAEEGVALGFSQYLVDEGQGLSTAFDLAAKIATNAPMTNFAVVQALPRIAEADPQTGLLMESLMAAVAQADGEAKTRIQDFLAKKAGKVRPA
ncbi:crotonase/enoyl-CoA hydratase family protein [Phreatobacter aquaticus]|uniref:Crotonase/enoyl-CoA hydratase family protein n=1 Tax=Phreatobacter aquaticus TaxID=2570229 RepID=A0A4D7QIG8_9HYPH|nr:crotonase/enoyl-CoA hydratase family protein [Phreatobacter aquaticus]QCK85553.1 crotonase/enoyl-CoA hydratase family protein [Phreatobacter aquaticus]